MGVVFGSGCAMFDRSMSMEPNSGQQLSYDEVANRMMENAKRLAADGDSEGAIALAKRAQALRTDDGARRFAGKNRIRDGSDAVSGTQVDETVLATRNQDLMREFYQDQLADASPEERAAILRNLQGADPQMVDQVLRERRRVVRMGQQSVAGLSQEIVSASRAESARRYLADASRNGNTLRAPDPRMTAARYGLGVTNPWNQSSFKTNENAEEAAVRRRLSPTPVNSDVQNSSLPATSEKTRVDFNVQPISNTESPQRFEDLSDGNGSRNPNQLPAPALRPRKKLVTLGGVTLSGREDQEGDRSGPPAPSPVADSALSAEEQDLPPSPDSSDLQREPTESPSDEPGTFFSQLPGKETILQAPSTLKSAIYNAGQGIRNSLKGEWLGSAGGETSPSQPATIPTQGSSSNANLQNIGQTADAPWSDNLQRLIRQAETEVARSQPGNTEIERQNHIARHVQLRMLHLIAGQFELALQPVPGIESNEQEFWQQMFWGMSSYFDSQGMPNAEDRAAQTIAQLKLATSRLERRARLEIRTAAFSRKINGFGDFQDLERNVFTPGQPILIYAEIGNLRSEPTADGKFRSVLKSTIEVTTAGDDGEILDRTELPAVEDICKSVRRDYFNSYKYTIPPQATLGRHVLILTVEDKLSQKVATYRLNFTIE